MNQFLQLGASFDGEWGIELLRQGWTGCFVEPHPGNVVQLYDILSREGFLEACDVFSVGVWENSGFQEFRTSGRSFSESNISSHIGESDTFYSKRIEVDGKVRTHRKVKSNLIVYCVTLAELLSRVGYCDRIRMDIEGAEVPILMSHVWLELPSVLEVEFHGKRHISDVESVLFKQGFGTLMCEGKIKRGSMNRVYGSL